MFAQTLIQVVSIQFAKLDEFRKIFRTTGFYFQCCGVLEIKVRSQQRTDHIGISFALMKENICPLNQISIQDGGEWAYKLLTNKL